ncbi:MAG: DUF4255 domain-containing protein [Chloroflexi bacterium]|nr:DUF4255 domain-containing protein [Chloroflexota bacterium]
MPLLDLSLVTQTLINLISAHVTNSEAWNKANKLEVEPLPADKLDGDNTLGLYLYHAVEETTGKHTYIPGVSDVPIRYTPLGLNLYYMLTAHSDLDKGGVYREQLMMGLAMKALHDHPLINDDTEVNGTQVMPALLRGNDNAFRIGMVPVKVDDAVSYWMAGSNAQRLAAYYHVSVIKLEPQQPSIRAGRVLTYNIFVLPSDAPRVDTTTNVISFTIPGEASPRSLELRPAQVTYDQGFEVVGSAFTGNNVYLQIRRTDWAAPVAVDASWNLAITASRITATVRATAAGTTVLPGLYAASVRVERWRTVPSGTRSVETSSNETPFAIAPRITSISAIDAQGRFTITGDTFEHADLPPESVSVFVGAARLMPGTAGSLDPGEFAVTGSTTIAARLPAGLTPGEALSLRLIIGGAKSAPQWVVAV